MAISMDKELGIGSWGPARLSSCVTLLFSKTRILSRCLDLVLEASRRAEQRVRSNNGLNEEESTIEDNSFLQRTLGNHGAARKYIRGPLAARTRTSCLWYCSSKSVKLFPSLRREKYVAVEQHHLFTRRSRAPATLKQGL